MAQKTQSPSTKKSSGKSGKSPPRQLRKAPRSEAQIWDLPMPAKRPSKIKKSTGSVLPARIINPPSDIRRQLHIIANHNFQPVPQLRIYPGQIVHRKGDLLQRPLRVLCWESGKLFLNDLTLVSENEIYLADVALEFFDTTG